MYLDGGKDKNMVGKVRLTRGRQDLCNGHLLSPYFMPSTVPGSEGPESLNMGAHLEVHTRQRRGGVIQSTLSGLVVGSTN